MDRRDKVAARLNRARDEIYSLERQAKVQVGLSVAVKLSIQTLLGDLQEATTHKEQRKAKMIQRLTARGEKESTFFQSLGPQGKRLLVAQEEMLMCQTVLRQCNRFNFDSWVTVVEDERAEQIQRARAQQEEKEREEVGKGANQRKKRTAAQSNLQSTILPDIVQDAVQILLNVSLTSSMRSSTDSLQPIESLHFRDLSRLSSLDAHSVTLENLELLAPLLQSEAFLQYSNEYVSVADLPPDEKGYVGRVLCKLLLSLFEYANSICLREAERKSNQRLADKPKHSQVLGRGRSKSPQNAKSPPTNHPHPSSLSVPVGQEQLLENDQREREQEEIMMLKSQLLVSKRAMAQIQTKLDDAVAKKLCIIGTCGCFRVRVWCPPPPPPPPPLPSSLYPRLFLF